MIAMLMTLAVMAQGAVGGGSPSKDLPKVVEMRQMNPETCKAISEGASLASRSMLLEVKTASSFKGKVAGLTYGMELAIRGIEVEVYAGPQAIAGAPAFAFSSMGGFYTNASHRISGGNNSLTLLVNIQLRPGHYRWRARAIAHDGAAGAWAEFGRPTAGADFVLTPAHVPDFAKELEQALRQESKRLAQAAAKKDKNAKRELDVVNAMIQVVQNGYAASAANHVPRAVERVLTARLIKLKAKYLATKCGLAQIRNLERSIRMVREGKASVVVKGILEDERRLRMESK